jgi:muramoyltetrapeptide carboxypeptidase
MIFPSALKPGSTIGIIAPSGRINPDIVAPTCDFFQKLGYQVVLGNYIANNHFQFSATDEERLADLQSMLDSPDVDAIWCFRGGYGLIRIIDQLDFSQFLLKPKLFLGFSDITVMHACLQNKYGIGSIHSSMAKYLLETPFHNTDIQATINIIKGEMPEYQIIPNSLNRLGKAEGILTGGNLSLLYALRGTPYDFNPEGKILFIEDLNEYLYHLDRMMHNLKLGGVLAKISGLIVGQFSDMKDNDTPFGQTAYEIIRSAVDEYDYPVIFDFPAGHSVPNYPLYLGKTIAISSESDNCVICY